MNGIHIIWNSLFPLGNVYYVHEVKNDFFSLALQAKLEHILAFLAHSAVRHLPYCIALFGTQARFSYPFLLWNGGEWRERKLMELGSPLRAVYCIPFRL